MQRDPELPCPAMPTNVTPEYKNAEQRYRQAQTVEEQLEALLEMLATLPKHKGTEKLQADIRRKISTARREMQQRRRARGHRPAHIIDRAEGGQTVLVGPPNSGKSLLLARLTNANPEVADYPFSTQVPTPGMMPFENVQLQLVDLPPLDPSATEGWVYEAIKRADLLLLVLDAASDDLLSHYATCGELLRRRRLSLVAPADRLTTAASGEEAWSAESKPALLVANKMDHPAAEANLGLLMELVGDALPVVRVSAATGAGLEVLRRAIFEGLRVVRVYTKAPGRPGDRTSPFMLPRGATVLDAARSVHQEFAQSLKYARLWGRERFEGQMVGRDHVLEDEDMVEFHT